MKHKKADDAIAVDLGAERDRSWRNQDVVAYSMHWLQPKGFPLKIFLPDTCMFSVLYGTYSSSTPLSPRSYFNWARPSSPFGPILVWLARSAPKKTALGPERAMPQSERASILGRQPIFFLVLLEGQGKYIIVERNGSKAFLWISWSLGFVREVKRITRIFQLFPLFAISF